jgi:signal transduction histidine kinase
MSALPSIQARLGNALLAWALVWSVAVSAAVWLAADREVGELLDDELQSSADVLAVLLGPAAPGEVPGQGRAGAGWTVPSDAAGTEPTRFAWQLVAPGGEVLARSAHAPEKAWRGVPTPGFTTEAQWRVLGRALPGEGRMLYVAQAGQERHEAKVEVALSAILSALAVGLLGHVWLRARVRHELEPLRALSDWLAAHDPLEAGTRLGRPGSSELAPMHAALEGLSRRLAVRIAREQAFSAHAAHALRTPLAGIDAQLAVALREAPPEMRPRLGRVRDAATRLQGVVAALLALFRPNAEPQRRPVDLAALVQGLAVAPLEVRVADGSVDADPGLLSAALLNLLDNARRHGAQVASVSLPAAGTVRVLDDGPGLPPAQRQALQEALDAQDYAHMPGLGLVLADLVGRAHGGGLALPEVPRGFAVDLQLSPGAPRA